MLKRTLVLMALSATTALGQSTQRPQVRSNIEFARSAWREVRTWLLQAAQDTPDSVFAFRPAADVRSFLETLDHVAASQRGYCQMALGEKPSGGGAGTGARTKSDVGTALRLADEVCSRAYAQSEDSASLPAYGGSRTTRLHVLLTNTIHDNEHYGNVVTYLRLNGIVPPSSRPTAP